jgi:hypothetical protein
MPRPSCTSRTKPVQCQSAQRRQKDLRIGRQVRQDNLLQSVAQPGRRRAKYICHPKQWPTQGEAKKDLADVHYVIYGII